jgi:glycerol-3-phosphate dehydrogenase (NAD(P)+)
MIAWAHRADAARYVDSLTPRRAWPLDSAPPAIAPRRPEDDAAAPSIIGAGAWARPRHRAAAGQARGSGLGARPTSPDIRARHENPLSAGQRLDRAIQATADLYEAAQCEAALLCTPAQHLRAVTTELARHLPKSTPVVICAKGIEQESGLLMTEVIAATLPGRPMAVLSGPTFAAEVARGLPTAVTLACADARVGGQLVKAIGTATFRPYLSDDPIGAEIGGAVKNVLAIACGICTGAASARTRGPLMLAPPNDPPRPGAVPSRRRWMGLLARRPFAHLRGLHRVQRWAWCWRGTPLADILGERRSVAEGVHSAGAVVALARRLSVEMPISAAVDAIVNGGADIDTTIAALLDRPFTVELTALP